MTGSGLSRRAREGDRTLNRYDDIEPNCQFLKYSESGHAAERNRSTGDRGLS